MWGEHVRWDWTYTRWDWNEPWKWKVADWNKHRKTRKLWRMEGVLDLHNSGNELSLDLHKSGNELSLDLHINESPKWNSPLLDFSEFLPSWIPCVALEDDNWSMKSFPWEKLSQVFLSKARLNKFLTDNHHKAIYRVVRTELSFYRVYVCLSLTAENSRLHRSLSVSSYISSYIFPFLKYS